MKEKKNERVKKESNNHNLHDDISIFPCRVVAK